ncbi:MAG TPA: hypothetical protein VF710_06405 [Longimicrobium sp.]
MPVRARRPFLRARARRLGGLARSAVRPNHSLGATTMKDAQPVPFVVGRISKEGRRMMVLDPATPPPIPGPWDLRAVFTL